MLTCRDICASFIFIIQFSHSFVRSAVIHSFVCHMIDVFFLFSFFVGSFNINHMSIYLGSHVICLFLFILLYVFVMAILFLLVSI